MMKKVYSPIPYTNTMKQNDRKAAYVLCRNATPMPSIATLYNWLAVNWAIPFNGILGATRPRTTGIFEKKWSTEVCK